METEVGKISSELNKKEDKTTPLKKKLAFLGKVLVLISVVLCLVVVGLAFLWVWIHNGHIRGKDALNVIEVDSFFQLYSPQSLFFFHLLSSSAFISIHFTSSDP